MNWAGSNHCMTSARKFDSSGPIISQIRTLPHYSLYTNLDSRPFWPCKEGSREQPCPKWFECWNTALGFTLNVTSANQHSSSTKARSEYVMEHKFRTTWKSENKVAGFKNQQDTSKQGYILQTFLWSPDQARTESSGASYIIPGKYNHATTCLQSIASW